VPLPATVAVPTAVPPLVHVLGADACGPNTLKLTAPVAVDVPPDSAPPIDDAGIATPREPVDGADAAIDVGRNTETLNEYRPAAVLRPPDCDQNIVSLTL